MVTVGWSHGFFFLISAILLTQTYGLCGHSFRPIYLLSNTLGEVFFLLLLLRLVQAPLTNLICNRLFFLYYNTARKGAVPETSAANYKNRSHSL